MIWSIIRRLVFRHSWHFRHFKRTHAAIYSSDKGVNAVVHIHSIELWNELIYKVPTTNLSMDYGTIGLAKDIFSLFKNHMFMRRG